MSFYEQGGMKMRVIAIVKRICQEIIRDKRTMAMLFLAPLLILSLMNLLFDGDTEEPTLGVINVDTDFVGKLQDADVRVEEFEESQDAKQTVIESNLDGLLQMDQETFELVLKNNDPSTAKALEMKVSQLLMVQAQEKLLKQNPKRIKQQENNLKSNYVYGDEDTDFFDTLSPILVGFFVFFFTFIISGVGLLKERTSGTLERLMATPIRKWEIVTAYLIGFGIFSAIQTVIVVLFAVHILDVVLVGSIWNVFIINIILAFVALSLGILLSSFATSEFQLIQFIPLVIVPQIFFSGIIPLDGVANWLQVLAKIMPFYYGANALDDVMYKGFQLVDVSQDLIILIGFALVFIILNIIALRRYRVL